MSISKHDVEIIQTSIKKATENNITLRCLWKKVKF